MENADRNDLLTSIEKKTFSHVFSESRSSLAVDIMSIMCDVSSFRVEI